MVLAGIVLVVLLFVVRPGAGWLRGRIIRNISLALGRPVDIRSVSIRLMPQPGFDLGGFMVYDDPAFGAEPMLRSDDVTAVLRIVPLLRGHLEIASLRLSEPSLNLGRRADGHWNVEDLLNRTAQTAVAPTIKAKTEKRPGFPYIESTRGRINLKLGQEKTPYALTNADFSLWQESENTWGMRLKAQPVRTDFNLSDTGVLKVSGTWGRAARLRQTPLQFTIAWTDGQLGQASKLVYGSDKGWRGTVSLSASVSGAPENLLVTTDASFQNFRRYDVMRSPLRLAATCIGHYSFTEHTVSGINCAAPVGDGNLGVSGKLADITTAPTYNLLLTAKDVPAGSIAAFVHYASNKFPDALLSSGHVNADVEVTRSAEDREPKWTGSGVAAEVHLAAANNNSAVVLDTVPFSIVSAAPAPAKPRRRSHTVMPESISGNRVIIGPFEAVAPGNANSVAGEGWISRTGYSFQITGGAQVRQVLEIARMLNISSFHPAADGTAQVNLAIAGGWSDAKPQVTGKAQLRQVRAEVRGVNVPLEIGSANLLLEASSIEVQNLTASLGDTSWRGSMILARQAAAESPCRIRFSLHADEISLDDLGQVLNPHLRKRPWYRFRFAEPESAAPFLLTACANGSLSANRVRVRGLLATHVSATIGLDRGRLNVTGLEADVLGGKHVGVWQADFTGKTPEYRGSGIFRGVSLEQLADVMHDDWVTGVASANYRVKASGVTQEELVSSADGTLEVEARDADFPHVTLINAADPLHVHHFVGRFLLNDGKLTVDAGKLDTPGSIYQLSGSASLARKLDLKLTRDSTHSLSITGTLSDPHVEPAASGETQAALKP